MRAERDGRRHSRLHFTIARLISPAFAIAIGFYLGAQGPAYSQIESRQVSPPTASVTTQSALSLSTEKYPVPKAPAQVEMPAPPPTKIFAGLEEPLVATGDVTEAESKDLDAALAAFHDAPAKAGPGSDYSDYSKPLTDFIEAHPQSNWNAAIYTNLGFGYYRAGYYSRVFPELEKAWQLGRNADSFQARLMVDRAVGELARMHARLGHGPELEALFKDVGKRPIGGPATETIQGAREGLWNFHHNPGEAYLCGPKALVNLLMTLKASPKQIKIADEALSGEHGVSLTELASLADKTKLKYKLIHREPGQPIPVPSVINWTVHHYAAITGMHDDLYEVKDPTFAGSGSTVLTSKAIDAEGSGYFLVPSTIVAANPKAGWRMVSANSAEAKAVYGMGDTTSNQQGETMCVSCMIKAFGNQFLTGDPIPANVGMTGVNAHPMVVSLNLSDTPAGYKPQKGLPALITLVYNSREAEQPANFSYSNVGPKWTLNLSSFIAYNPGYGYSTPLTYIPGGGGGNTYPVTYDGYTGSYTNEPWTGAIMNRIPIGGGTPSFKRALDDGGVENFTLSNGAATAPALSFITTALDKAGNTSTYHYDGSFRLTSVVDAMGRSTTFTYGLSGYPLLITKIADPFGRAAQLNYDTSGRLSSITDAIGITSSFTYSTTETTFITQLTTPYGSSTYSDTVDPNDTVETNTRSLTMTDPLGYTDYLYFYENPAIVPNSDPTASVPTGMPTALYNGYLSWRNTFTWDKHAFALGVTMTGGVVTAHDYTKASITHWMHNGYVVNQVETGSMPESVKPPLENRTWFNYPNQYGNYSFYTGTLNKPTGIGRVLDDGTSQVSKATYNAVAAGAWPAQPGTLASSTDPKGRVTKYTYATNYIDLLTVQQLTTSPSTYSTIATYGSYNTLHEPQTYTDAAGQVWHFTWNTAGQIATTTDPNSGVTTYNYDSSSRLSNIQNANLHTQVSYTYDGYDRVQTRTDSEGYVLTYGYDALDRVTSITYPDGTTDLNDYTFQSGPNMGNPSLELRKHTDRLGRVTTYGYDADQRLTSVTEPTQGTSTRTTSYQYYENGVLKDIIDANGNDTHWDIDIESRPTKKTYAYGTSSAQAETYAYENTTSRLKSVTDALGQKKTFAYGLDDRITGITYTSSVNTTPNVTFAWDTYFPRLTSMADGTGTTNYSYTAIGTNGALKLSSIAGPYSNDTIGLTYDALGRLAGRNITGGNETFGYDAISRLTSHGTPLGSFTEGYLGQTSQMTSQSVTNGSTTVSTGWGYDTNTNDRRLIGITNSSVSRSYTLGYGSGPTNVYDIMSITDTAATGHPWATQSRGYTYDLIDRLLTASATTPGNDTYAYDPLDNATTVTTPTGTVTPAPTYNGLNQISTWGSNTYSFDANGNTLSGDGTRTYKWDAQNRLVEVDYTGTSNKTIFTYNGIGQRRAAAETNAGTTTTTRYLWCDSRICQTRDGSDNVLRRDLAEGEYNVSTGQKLVYMTDQLGSVRDVLDATTGTLVQSYDYTPYGGIARSSGSTPTDYEFAYLYYHPASGLNFSTTRPEDGSVGRWLTRDPIRELGGTNLYAYVGADPINYVDSNGLAGQGPNHSQSLQNDPEDWFGPNGWGWWTKNWPGDGSHDEKMMGRCRELRKWMANVCITDPALKAKADAARAWCDKNFPDGGGSAPAPVTPSIPSTPAPGNSYIPRQTTVGIGTIILIITETIGTGLVTTR
jgi:RHS repeat-associated protein